MNIHDKIDRYFKVLSKLPRTTKVTDKHAGPLLLTEAFGTCMMRMETQTQSGYKIMFIGNGASAAISAHCASDYTKAGRLRAVNFNDGVALTCLSNDFSYEEAFAKQIDYHARAGDILVAISSSGKSINILNAVEMARRKGCTIYTFSGLKSDNPLRKMGDINFYVNSTGYGLVEVTHHALLHAMLDIYTGWEK